MYSITKIFPRFLWSIFSWPRHSWWHYLFLLENAGISGDGALDVASSSSSRVSSEDPGEALWGQVGLDSSGQRFRPDTLPLILQSLPVSRAKIFSRLFKNYFCSQDFYILRPGFLYFVYNTLILGRCWDSNPSCCDCSQMCYQWDLHILSVRFSFYVKE